MRNGRWVVVAMAGFLAAYFVAPYIAIWQIAAAMRAGDATTLAARIDWNSVRSGLKADIAEGLMTDFTPEPGSLPATARLASSHDTLPPFGASFFSGIAGSVVDREVTPEHVVSMVRQFGSGDGEPGLPISVGNIRHAFFDGPTSFELSVRCPGQDADDQPLRLRLALRERGWVVVRAWVSQDLVDLANSRT